MQTDDSTDKEAQKAEDFVAYWLGEIAAAKKREDAFRKTSYDTIKLYEMGKSDTSPYNILYANTETLAPALYNSTPRPVVGRRFKDEDALGAMASKAGQRTLEYLSDDGMAEYATFDELMKSAVLEALVPGRGVSRFKYDAMFQKVQNQKSAEGVEEEGSSAGEDDAKDEAAVEEEHVSYETVCGEEVPWDHFCHGYAKKWKDVPWICYDELMTREELVAHFGAVGAQVPISESDGDTEDEGNTRLTVKGQKVAIVHTIWDKTSRKVIFITPNWKDSWLKKVDDPLELSGFFPSPKPLQLFAKVTDLLPVTLYSTYESQAKELNTITIRINKVIKALKVRGMYDTTVEGIDKVLEAEDNVLIPAQNVAALLAQGNALEKALWLMPIEKLVPVLQQLYVQRDQIKAVIFEINGIADIMRGSSQASETLGAQKLKTQWGGLRLKRMQKEVARYARDCLRIMLEIAVSKLSPKTLKSMTGLPYPTGEEKQQAEMVAQQLSMTGQPPPEELATVLGQPSWDDILGMLRDDTERSYRVDIETNSTVDAEATEDKEDIAELLNAISQFLNGVAPLVEQGAMPFEVAQGMLLAIVRRFQFGPELEDQLKKMRPPQPKQDPKVEADKAQAQVDLQMKQLDLQAKQREFQQREREMALEAQYKQQEYGMKMQEMQRKGELALLQHSAKIEATKAQAAAAKAKPAATKN